MGDLKLPPMRYRLANTMDDRPSKSDVERERRHRIRELNGVAHRGLWGKWCRKLAAALSNDRVELETMANPVYVWDLQDPLTGNIHQLLDEEDRDRVATFTVAKKSWAKHPAEIWDEGITDVLGQFRKNLTDAYGKVTKGWLICAVEAAYDFPTGSYQKHIHGVATEDFIDAIDSLRERRSYRPWAEEPGIARCRRPIVIREGLTDLPRPFAYMLKRYWKMRRAGERRRLPGEEHIRSLLILNRYRVDDVVMMINVHVKNGRLETMDQ